ncbi:MAG: hypothetical protein ACJ77B_00815 [Chloroflexota bacterium]
MQRGLLIVAGLVAVIGLVFIGQGLGILRGSSFMVGDIKWAIIGAVLVVIGGLVAWRSLRSARR